MNPGWGKELLFAGKAQSQILPRTSRSVVLARWRRISGVNKQWSRNRFYLQVSRRRNGGKREKKKKNNALKGECRLLQGRESPEWPLALILWLYLGMFWSLLWAKSLRVVWIKSWVLFTSFVMRDSSVQYSWMTVIAWLGNGLSLLGEYKLRHKKKKELSQGGWSKREENLEVVGSSLCPSVRRGPKSSGSVDGAGLVPHLQGESRQPQG